MPLDCLLVHWSSPKARRAAATPISLPNEEQKTTPDSQKSENDTEDHGQTKDLK